MTHTYAHIAVDHFFKISNTTSCAAKGAPFIVRGSWEGELGCPSKPLFSTTLLVETKTSLSSAVLPFDF